MTDHLKAKGEALAAEIVKTTQTVAVFATRARYGAAGRPRGGWGIAARMAAQKNQSREYLRVMNDGAYLNIGLLAGTTPVDPFVAICAVESYAGEYGYSTIQRSDTEDTLVVELRYPLGERALFEIASALNQEAIAQFSHKKGGELVGPKAKAWGEFDPERFLLLDGRRLVDL